MVMVVSTVFTDQDSEIVWAAMTGSAVDTAGTVTAADNKSANRPVAILINLDLFEYGRLTVCTALTT